MLEEIFKVAGNYFFPIVLSCYLIYRIDGFLSRVDEAIRKMEIHQAKILIILSERVKK